MRLAPARAPALRCSTRRRASLRCRASALPVAPSPALPPPSEEEARVEAAFRTQFGALPVQRALASFTRMARGAPFEHAWPGLGLQQAGSYVDGLTARPFHDVVPTAGEAGFAWMGVLETHWATIAAELSAATAAGGAEASLQRKGRRVWAAAARADAAGYGPEWRTLVLQDRGRWDDKNAALFPQTVRLVRDVAAAPSVECFFARQAPGSGIKPHTDNCNFVMTAHLGLDVPEGQCWLKVGDVTKGWANGKGLVFDTSFVHETMNEAQRDRFVLLVRFWHPELTQVRALLTWQTRAALLTWHTQIERVAIQFLFDAADDSSAAGLKAAARAADKSMAKLALRGGAAGAAPRGFGKRA